MEEEQTKQSDRSEPPKKPGRVNTILLKVLMLIVFALMMGMCTIKYMS
jgi:hypothetical protein